MRKILQKDIFNKYIDIHFQPPKYQREFKYYYPKYLMQLKGIMHFKRHI